MRILDVRHEQTAAFAAEAMGKLTRTPGLAVLTAGPGVTNGVSAIAQAQFSGSPLVVVGGRAPQNRWGSGSLQELDQPPILAPVSKLARTIHTARRGRRGDARGVHPGRLARTAGRSSSTSRWTSSSTPPPSRPDRWSRRSSASSPTATRSPRSPSCSARPSARCSILGTDVWADGAEEAALRLVEEAGLPVITNGMGRGVIPGGHPLLVTKARGAALGGADLVVVAGTPLDFRLGYGVFGGKDGATPARVVHLADSPGQVSQHADLAGEASGDLTLVLDGLRDAVAGLVRRPDWSSWVSEPAGHREGGRRARRRAARRDGRPDPPGPHLRRAGPAARRGRRRDRRRRRLRLLRRQVRRAEASRRLARPRALRLPRRRPRRGHRRPASRGRPPRSCCCTATAPPACR